MQGVHDFDQIGLRRHDGFGARCYFQATVTCFYQARSRSGLPNVARTNETGNALSVSGIRIQAISSISSRSGDSYRGMRTFPDRKRHWMISTECIAEHQHLGCAVTLRDVSLEHESQSEGPCIGVPFFTWMPMASPFWGTRNASRVGAPEKKSAREYGTAEEFE